MSKPQGGSRSSPRGPPPAPWTDARLAAALSQVSSLGPVTTDQVGAILKQDCPYVSDPALLVRDQHGPEAEAAADAVMSVLAQSGRC